MPELLTSKQMSKSSNKDFHVKFYNDVKHSGVSRGAYYFYYNYKGTTKHFHKVMIFFLAWLTDLDFTFLQNFKNFDGQNVNGVSEKKNIGKILLGWLGRFIRVVTPACAHARIDREYPDPDGNYTGTILELD